MKCCEADFAFQSGIVQTSCGKRSLWSALPLHPGTQVWKGLRVWPVRQAEVQELSRPRQLSDHSPALAILKVQAGLWVSLLGAEADRKRFTGRKQSFVH